MGTPVTVKCTKFAAFVPYRVRLVIIIIAVVDDPRSRECLRLRRRAATADGRGGAVRGLAGLRAAVGRRWGGGVTAERGSVAAGRLTCSTRRSYNKHSDRFLSADGPCCDAYVNVCVSSTHLMEQRSSQPISPRSMGPFRTPAAKMRGAKRISQVQTMLALPGCRLL